MIITLRVYLDSNVRAVYDPRSEFVLVNDKNEINFQY